MNKRLFANLILPLFIAGSILAGCAGQPKDTLDTLNGTWKSDDGGKKIVLNINGKQQTVRVEDKEFVIESETVERETISMAVKDPSGKKLAWKFVRVWNDNGSEFTLNFVHDGKVEHLTKSGAA